MSRSGRHGLKSVMIGISNINAPKQTNAPEIGLKRTLTLPLLILYGVGVTIGAGIYVLIGVTAGKAGLYAPLSFVLAAIVVAFSAASFAEMSCRYPFSAGEAAYVRAGFRSNALSLVIGLLVVLAGVVSSAAISVGAAGYVLEFIHLPETLIICTVVILMAAIAAWGIMESVTFAGVFTIIEVGGLMAIVGAGLISDPGIVVRLGSVFPPLGDFTPWLMVFGATMLAFFAFVGFEDIVNLAEEVREPRRTLPWAIFCTLAISTLIYFFVAAVAVLSVPTDELAASRAPLGFVFNKITGLPSTAINAIAIVATLNGVIIQIIMASRVLYGLAKQGSILKQFAHINATTRTPLVATATVATVILLLGLFFPLENLAEMTSRVVLTIFMTVNAALVAIKFRGEQAPEGSFQVGIWVPIIGFFICLLTLAGDLFFF